MPKQSSGGDKADRDNRATQLNPNNWKYEKAREEPQRQKSPSHDRGSKGDKRGK